MPRPWLLTAFAALSLLLTTSLTACSNGDGPSITVYNAQHEELLNTLAPIFERQTGIEVNLRNGEDSELANQLVAEGKASPADVFLTENSPAMSLVDSQGLLAPVAADTLSRVPAQYAPANGHWVGFAARSTVLVYNTDLMSEKELPESLLDLADPQWAGKVAFSPTGADFQAIVSAVVQLEGKAAALRWLQGLQANGTVYQENTVVLQSVNDGEVATGIIYHYYWYQDQAEAQENSDRSALHFFGGGDPGAFVSVSGAGVLKSSDHQEDAQKFLDFLTNETGQQALADSDAMEYPLNPGISLDPPVKPFAELDPPKVDLTRLNGPDVVDLMQEVGFL